MNQLLSSLHPNPGWTGAALAPVANQPISDTVGKHCILELYGCSSAKLDDEVFLRDAITTAAQLAGATLLNLITHRFEPQGVTGLALLAESHISIHTWPESGYAAVDVFTCGDHTMPERACQVLAERLDAGNHKLTSFRRETPSAIADTPREPELEPHWLASVGAGISAERLAEHLGQPCF
ncbi:adenosylmethionine decarboxylase [Cyanobium sp. HWJ4-Hawea]|uniref:adenosylmethionine decarboxylase n=1 Tax=Cyanobium sp. HWJ4-Hawea TaxID=2823713 RepID=UPI0020CE5EED|nr:adenosylmethionine decarboxylase [Cyanobium sp. HWJ4-Hawea]MCP9809418.1 adenosylmethionine decarboxylase [Cyanobium sp. HWJ4-Hawea]